jgi:putative zinc finger/helix-turn-helix YgiT family protein
MPYAIDVKHDGQSYHLEIPKLTIPKCRACGELVFSNSVDDQIIEALRSHLRLLTPEQIRGGRETLGLKAKELAERLGVAAETISRWERGGLIQSRAMDNYLRVYFAVPEARAVLRGAEQGPDLGTAPTWGLDEVIEQLNQHRRRATYGAVAAVVGRAPQDLMHGRPPCPRGSWVVAKRTVKTRLDAPNASSRRGWPTGYPQEQIHPECLRQIRESPNDFIADADELRRWLRTVCAAWSSQESRP